MQSLREGDLERKTVPVSGARGGGGGLDSMPETGVVPMYTSSTTSTPTKRNSHDVPNTHTPGSSKNVPGESPLFPSTTSGVRKISTDQGGVAGAGAGGCVGVYDDWFNDGDILPDPFVIARRVARLIMLLRLFIQRFHLEPTQLVTLQILAGRDDLPVLTLTLRSTDTIGTLRVKVANHFKEDADGISLLKPGKTSQLLSALGGGLERLENDVTTIGQAKFAPHDAVIARKKDPPPPPLGGPRASKGKESAAHYDIHDS